MFERPPTERQWVSWLWVVLVALAIYVTIPFARAISQVVTDRWGREIFRDVVLGAIVAGSCVALLLLWRCRHRIGRQNVFWIIFVGLLYFHFTMSLKASPEESLHFIEYGILGVMLFRALSHRTRDPGVYVVAVLLGSLAGTMDEVIQWLTPHRVFDYRDVGFNAISGVLAQTAIWKGFTPPFIVRPIRPSTVQRICAVAALNVMLLGACLMNTPRWTDRLVRIIPRLEHVRHKSSAMTEYGYKHVIPSMGVFHSRFTLGDLMWLDRKMGKDAARKLDRLYDPRRYGEFLSTYSPVTDPFLHEARVHLFRRDHYYAVAPKYEGDPELFPLHHTVAYRENQFMEAYFPVMMSHSRNRYSESRVEALKRNMNRRMVYESEVSSELITMFTVWHVRWMLLAALVVLGAVDAYSRWWEKKKGGSSGAS